MNTMTTDLDRLVDQIRCEMYTENDMIKNVEIEETGKEKEIRRDIGEEEIQGKYIIHIRYVKSNLREM